MSQYKPLYQSASCVTIKKGDHPAPWIKVSLLYEEYICRDFTSLVEYKIYNWLRCCKDQERVILSPTWLSTYLNVGSTSIYRALEGLREKGYFVTDTNGRNIFVEIPARIIEMAENKGFQDEEYESESEPFGFPYNELQNEFANEEPVLDEPEPYVSDVPNEIYVPNEFTNEPIQNVETESLHFQNNEISYDEIAQIEEINEINKINDLNDTSWMKQFEEFEENAPDKAETEDTSEIGVGSYLDGRKIIRIGEDGRKYVEPDSFEDPSYDYWIDEGMPKDEYRVKRETRSWVDLI